MEWRHDLIAGRCDSTLEESYRLPSSLTTSACVWWRWGGEDSTSTRAARVWGFVV